MQVQLEKLTETFQTVTEDLKQRFAVNGESLVDETNIVGSSPMSAGNSPFRTSTGSGGFASQRGFTMHQRPSMASSGAPVATPAAATRVMVPPEMLPPAGSEACARPQVATSPSETLREGFGCSGGTRL